MKIFTEIVRLAFCIAIGFTASGISARNLTGEWSGQLKVTPQMKLKIVFHIEDKAVYLDSPDQGAYGPPYHWQKSIHGWSISSDRIRPRI